MKKIVAFSSLAVFALLTACATTPNNSLAIQKENNLYEVTGLGKSNIIAKNNAITAANKTCGKSHAPVLLDEKTEYNGALKWHLIKKSHQGLFLFSNLFSSYLYT